MFWYLLLFRAYASQSAAENDMRGGKTFCEAYPTLPACQ